MIVVDSGTVRSATSSRSTGMLAMGHSAASCARPSSPSMRYVSNGSSSS
jgi:hypothetical protein